MARISAFKARETARHIQGMPAKEALELLRFSPRKAARLVSKTLKTAIANAENNNGLSPDTLFVKQAVINEGPTLKRFQPKARGSAGPIRKRTSHIYIVLDERAEKPKKAKKVQKTEGKKTKKKATAEAIEAEGEKK